MCSYSLQIFSVLHAFFSLQTIFYFLPRLNRVSMESPPSKSPPFTSLPSPNFEGFPFDSEFEGLIVPDSCDDSEEGLIVPDSYADCEETVVPESCVFDGDGEKGVDMPDLDMEESQVDLDGWAEDWTPAKRDCYLRCFAMWFPRIATIWMVNNPSARREDAELKQMVKSNVCKAVLALAGSIIAMCVWIVLLLVVHYARADPDFSSLLVILYIMEVCLGICCAIDLLFLVILSASVIGNLYCLYLLRIDSQDKVVGWFQNTSKLASLLTFAQSTPTTRTVTIAQVQVQDQAAASAV